MLLVLLHSYDVGHCHSQVRSRSTRMLIHPSSSWYIPYPIEFNVSENALVASGHSSFVDHGNYLHIHRRHSQA